MTQGGSDSRRRQRRGTVITLPRCLFHFQSLLHVFFVYGFISLLIAPSLIAARGSLQIMGRLATVCNLLKFKMIFCSPMGMPFACSTAVTNRCNLLIMGLHCASLYMKLPLITSALTCPFTGLFVWQVHSFPFPFFTCRNNAHVSEIGFKFKSKCTLCHISFLFVELEYTVFLRQFQGSVSFSLS